MKTLTMSQCGAYRHKNTFNQTVILFFLFLWFKNVFHIFEIILMKKLGLIMKSKERISKFSIFMIEENIAKAIRNIVTV